MLLYLSILEVRNLSQVDRKEEDIRRMADMLRQGSTLTELACPACASPLFRLKDDSLWCAKCEKKVVTVKEGEDPSKIEGSMVLINLERTLLVKIQKIQSKMQNEENMEELQKMGNVLSGLLENLEKIRKTKKV